MRHDLSTHALVACSIYLMACSGVEKGYAQPASLRTDQKIAALASALSFRDEQLGDSARFAICNASDSLGITSQQLKSALASANIRTIVVDGCAPVGAKRNFFVLSRVMPRSARQVVIRFHYYAPLSFERDEDVTVDFDSGLWTGFILALFNISST